MSRHSIMFTVQSYDGGVLTWLHFCAKQVGCGEATTNIQRTKNQLSKDTNTCTGFFWGGTNPTQNLNQLSSTPSCSPFWLIYMYVTVSKRTSRTDPTHSRQLDQYHMGLIAHCYWLHSNSTVSRHGQDICLYRRSEFCVKVKLSARA